MCSDCSTPSGPLADNEALLPHAPTPPPARKRKAVSYAEDEYSDTFDHQTPKKNKKSKKTPEIIDLTMSSPEKPREKKGKRKSDAPTEEKRLRRFRTGPTISYSQVKSRAMTQRLTVLSRERQGTDEVPEEKITMAGSTGNVYTQVIGLSPSCNCPHAEKGNQCKHIIYVMLRVLKAPEEIAYQLALLSSELRDLFKNAPPIPGVELHGKDGTENEELDSNRKPIEGECPICYDDLGDKESTVYCKASCGNNVHKDCMMKWLAMKTTCPYCRAKWVEDTGLDGVIGGVNMTGLARNEDGYVNVASQLGLSGERDYSSYHQFWVRRHLGSGRGGSRGRRYDYDYDD
ncbi:hypothetical protein IQ07DRAFT_588804 [Pyrenochaeta sp. DS3sAY3a]|nr:hypothetical protein IQ07DRAFT_588804 [Pyrenochaeta sp. DS3sAY3a]